MAGNLFAISLCMYKRDIFNVIVVIDVFNWKKINIKKIRWKKKLRIFGFIFLLLKIAELGAFHYVLSQKPKTNSIKKQNSIQKFFLRFQFFWMILIENIFELPIKTQISVGFRFFLHETRCFQKNCHQKKKGKYLNTFSNFSKSFIEIFFFFWYLKKRKINLLFFILPLSKEQEKLIKIKYKKKFFYEFRKNKNYLFLHISAALSSCALIAHRLISSTIKEKKKSGFVHNFFRAFNFVTKFSDFSQSLT